MRILIFMIMVFLAPAIVCMYEPEENFWEIWTPKESIGGYQTDTLTLKEALSDPKKYVERYFEKDFRVFTTLKYSKDLDNKDIACIKMYRFAKDSEISLRAEVTYCYKKETQ